MTAFDPSDLVSSFKAAGAWYNDDAMSLAPIPNMGWGAVARKPIAAHTPLFRIPLDYLLTPWTSSLKSHLTDAEWDALDGGWARLILCMMWEESRADSKWGGYLRNMPREFDSPMFWGEADRAELAGTDIENRIGKSDAEADYHAKLAPLLAARADLFPAGSEHFSLDAYHVQGSRILSRSFTIPISRAGGPITEPEEDEDGDEDEEEEVAVMVPMADMLNAAYERDNARLFADGEDDEDEEGEGEKHDFGEGFTMISTRDIAEGEQIYNTYASPPNSELLRKYGHVDILPLPEEVTALLSPEELGDWAFGNAGDEVEIPGTLVVEAAAARGISDAEARVDFWLDQGGDDTFGLTYSPDGNLEPPLVPFIRLLTSAEDWERAQKKGKLPKSVVDAPVLDVLEAVVRARAAKYPQTIAADLAVVSADGPLNARNAAVVRLGEKRILAATLRVVERERERIKAEEGKRKAGGKEERAAKRRK
ncbi:Ribosomal lysine N-methyltransferase 4 [Vanrija pseudolonga]|uniref:Ribosomal lysine N-methyltransferase 4 n=1 Tax=Vanrija pseudolonga TaxID=143232 RepID=A0AAF1BL23_9TREE|nr:Ribosomal lysine N-methyltransferase 4 [Vanrija pseudolonga]